MESGSGNSGKESSDSLLYFFKKLGKKSGGSCRRFGRRSYGLRWKKRWLFLDNILFKIVSVFEGVVLVSTLCFFYLCCGCHF